MDFNSKNDSMKEELLPSQPPPYETMINTTQQQQQQLPVTVIVNNTTVVQPVPVISVPSVVFPDPSCFCSETPREVRRRFIRWVESFQKYNSPATIKFNVLCIFTSNF